MSGVFVLCGTIRKCIINNVKCQHKQGNSCKDLLKPFEITVFEAINVPKPQKTSLWPQREKIVSSDNICHHFLIQF